MEKIDSEFVSAFAVVIITILAIAVYIVSGAGLGFYGLFVVAACVMLYTWHRISRATVPQPAMAQKPVAKKRTASRAARRRRSR